ncbi:MAG: ATP-binding protein [Candidatus Methanomethylophilaceae archaeon]|nr:ATP-binding protein [Candidatus Methanomethylophilaceae archaeon]
MPENIRYLPRLVEAEIDNTMQIMGAVSIEGPKGCGKTWCARSKSNSEFSLVNPEGNFANRKLAEIDPAMALKGDEPHLIDEWQDVPGIWDAVRYSVDMSNSNGRYILCGSSSVDKKKLSHSGSLRISPIRMHTMSLFESKESSGKISLSALFDGKLDTMTVKGQSLDDLSRLLVRGGWPGMLNSNPDRVSLELAKYLENACTIDAQKIDDKRRDVAGLMRTIRSLARNESTMATKTKIISDSKENPDDAMADATVDDYLDVFKRLFLTEDQFMFSPSYRSSLRVGKSPKRHLADPSLSVAALGMNTESLINDPKTLGFMFEALCERDLRIYSQSLGGKLYHYRDYRDNEIDAIVDVPGKGWGAFEIKLGSNSEEDAAKNLLRIRDLMESNGIDRMPQFLCFICGTGQVAYKRKDGVFVVPITALGP